MLLVEVWDLAENNLCQEKHMFIVYCILIEVLAPASISVPAIISRFQEILVLFAKRPMFYRIVFIVLSFFLSFFRYSFSKRGEYLQEPSTITVALLSIPRNDNSKLSNEYLMINLIPAYM